MKWANCRLALLAGVLVLVMASPDWADGLADYHAANDAIYAGNVCKAIEFYTAAIDSGELPPGHLATALNRRGVAYETCGDLARALHDYEEAVKATPHHYPTTTFNLVNLREKIKCSNTPKNVSQCSQKCTAVTCAN